MLRQRVLEWTREWEQQGWVRGMEKGMEEGLEKGEEIWLKNQQSLLMRQIERRFGQALFEPIQSIIQVLQSPKDLEQVGDWIIDCDNDETLLSNLTERFGTHDPI